MDVCSYYRRGWCLIWKEEGYGGQFQPAREERDGAGDAPAAPPHTARAPRAWELTLPAGDAGAFLIPATPQSLFPDVSEAFGAEILMTSFAR